MALRIEECKYCFSYFQLAQFKAFLSLSYFFTLAFILERLFQMYFPDVFFLNITTGQLQRNTPDSAAILNGDFYGTFLNLCTLQDDILLIPVFVLFQTKVPFSNKSHFIHLSFFTVATLATRLGSQFSKIQQISRIHEF